MSIMTFRGKNEFLSNMYECSFTWDGRTYRNSEAAYQSAKTLDPAERDKFSDMPGKTAKAAGRKVNLRSDWEEVKDGIMEEVVFAKFTQNPELLAMLAATGDMELTEGNTWNDTYWGVSLRTGNGQNKLGKILMKVRAMFMDPEHMKKLLANVRDVLMDSDAIDMLLEKRKEAEKKIAEEAERKRETAEELKAQLSIIPEYDFTGKEIGTKAFGRVTITKQENNIVHFTAGDNERKFLLPDCIALGFLIPDDPQIIADMKRKKELQDKLKKL